MESDYRVRGYSLSADKPAVTAQLIYDDPSGAYANFAALGQIGGDFRFLGVQANVGYAKRLSSAATIDFGLLRSQIRARYPGGEPFNYTEAYAGAIVGPVIGRVSYSPDYRRHGVSTLYSEIEAGFAPAADWRVSGHAGILVYLTAAPYWTEGSTHRDWRVSVGRQIGPVEVHAALSGGGPGAIYYGYQSHERTAFTIGGSVGF